MVSPDACELLITNYLSHLEDGFMASASDTGCFILTPFARPDGEFVELAAEIEPNGNVRLSDMGDTLGYLYVNGLTLSQGVLADIRNIGRRFGVRLEGSELVADPLAQVSEAFHGLMQSVLSVTDLIQRRRPQTHVQFDSEVESLIILSGVTYDAGYEVQGRDDRHTVRFHVDSDHNLLIQPLTAATEGSAFSWAERWAYRFQDIRIVNSAWRFVAVLDDRGKRSEVWSERALAPLQEYLVYWAEKERLEAMLTGRTG